MKKLIITIAALGALALPTAAQASVPGNNFRTVWNYCTLTRPGTSLKVVCGARSDGALVKMQVPSGKHSFRLVYTGSGGFVGSQRAWIQSGQLYIRWFSGQHDVITRVEFS